MKIYDISRTISPSIAVWPGDQRFEHRWTMQIEKGASVNLGAITLSVHTGTHADAPYHFNEAGVDINQLALEKFIGPAFVVEVRDASQIQLEHVRSLDFTRVKRVLFKTKASYLEDSRWENDFVYLATETAEFLGKQGVQLVGMDSPSVDSMQSKTLDTHKMLARYGIANLENVNLSQVPPGEYQLIALPLKLQGLDASPVRAVLIQGEYP
ncbi:MAG: arylformamidase [Candidatus Fraserbacteria bacterium RBG_16_55_9]|uniref:Kynurenine formamidase n=1 Tax=Fraserbacteria sp. (strain RBG_16_55_9) TaxID=1817864 RepID=A0A1F5UPM1_FRAXR|nr:MAG: arylformamidase [Candidatus Fraserbacteria bacterium RBG_16_55_9]